MSSVWVAIHPSRSETRILATAGPHETLLKARLGRDPQHPRALPALLEALAMWQGAQVRAALAVDDADSGYATSLWREWFAVFDRAPLYSLEVVDAHRRRRVRDGLTGLGAYRDLHQLLLREVAR